MWKVILLSRTERTNQHISSPPVNSLVPKQNFVDFKPGFMPLLEEPTSGNQAELGSPEREGGGDSDEGIGDLRCLVACVTGA